ncbi:nacht and wd40 domain protein [Fusarium avenaceum]|nr:nacht and wd40 domain protein [Fusarium avenaceum]
MKPDSVRSFQEGSDFHGMVISGGDSHLGNHFHEHTHLGGQSLSPTEQDEADLRSVRVIDPQNVPKTIENRTEPLLREASSWILDPKQCPAFASWKDGKHSLPSCRLLWISGQPGTGKTMLMITIIRDLENENKNSSSSRTLSYFFCQKKEKGLANGRVMLRSLIWMLLKQQPGLMRHLRKKIKESGQDLYNDSNAFTALSDVFLDMLKDPILSPVYFIVDAIDECDMETMSLKILFELIKESLEASVNVNWLVSSRPEDAAKARNWGIPNAPIDLDAHTLQAPVAAYIAHKLQTLEGQPGYTELRLKEISDEIHQRASNVFLWVSVVLRALHSQSGWTAMKTLKTFPSELSDLFDSMMTRLERGTDDLGFCQSVLANVFLAYSPLTLKELTVLADFESTDMTRYMVTLCSSFLTIDGETVSLLHESVREYLESNYERKLGQGQVVQGHATIYRRSIHAMSQLKENMYGTTDLGYNPCSSPPCHVNQLPCITYACLFWIDHLCKSQRRDLEEELADNGTVICFLRMRLLHWLEALSLIGRSYDSLGMLQRLRHVTSESTCYELSSFLAEAIRFVGKNSRTIATAPLQIYSSAILFSPKQSQIRNTFLHHIPRWVLIQPQTDDNWSSHSHILNDLKAYSNQGLIACYVDDGGVELWDATTALLHSKLDGYTGKNNTSITHVRETNQKAKSGSLAFSPDERYLALLLGDKSVRIWCTEIWTSTTEFSPPDNDKIYSTCFGTDSQWIALATFNSIRIHSTVTGSLVQRISTPQACMNLIAYPGSVLVSFGTQNKGLWVWQATTGELKIKLPSDEHDWSRHHSVVSSGSSNHARLAVWGTSQSLRIWNLDRGFYLREFITSRARINVVAVSPNQRWIASVDYRYQVKVWDTKLAIDSPQSEDKLEHFLTTYLSSNMSLVALQLYGGGKTTWTILETGVNQSQLKFVVNRGPQVAIFSPDNKYVLLFGNGLSIWSIRDRKLLFDVLDHEWRYHTTAAFSPNSERFACSKNGLLAIWHISLGKTPIWIHRFQNAGLINWPLSFSSDSRHLLSGRGTEVHVWNVDNGQHISCFNTETKKSSRTARERQRELKSLASTNEPGTVVLGWSDGTAEFRNYLTGDCLRAIQFNHIPNYLSVESDGTQICTERGVFSTGTSTPGQVQPSQSIAIGINLDRDWIKWGSHRLLLIPTEMNGSRDNAVRGSWVILRGTSSGAQYIKFDIKELARVYGTGL